MAPTKNETNDPRLKLSRAELVKMLDEKNEKNPPEFVKDKKALEGWFVKNWIKSRWFRIGAVILYAALIALITWQVFEWFDKDKVVYEVPKQEQERRKTYEEQTNEQIKEMQRKLKELESKETSKVGVLKDSLAAIDKRNEKKNYSVI